MKLYDITRTITSSTAVWPGDSEPRLRWTARLEDGASVNVGEIRLSTHTATHVDAPLHYELEGHPVDAYPLEVFIGDAFLIDLRPCDVIRPKDIDQLPVETTRLLVRTGHSAVADGEWRDDFTTFDPETIHALGRRGVVLIGTDAPSFDPAESRDLPSHHALAAARIANLENLQLTGVPEGRCRLFALPLKIAGMDAAPVRAVVMSEA